MSKIEVLNVATCAAILHHLPWKLLHPKKFSHLIFEKTKYPSAVGGQHFRRYQVNVLK
jgi:hypothetical protein